MSATVIHAVRSVIILSFMTISLFAQGTTGSILGTVYDQSRAVLPGVTVVALSPDTGERREAISDEQGRYLIAQLRIGRYRVEAQLPGFQTSAREVILTLEGDAVVNFTMVVGTEQTEITITSEAPLVETSSSSIKGLVDEQQIRDLPLNGRSFTQLATIQTGVIVNYNQVSSQIGNEGTKISIAGARSTNTSFLLDGTEIRNQRSTTPGSLAGVLLGVDTVQEFRVVAGVASAEYGALTGGVVNAVTRSGSNEFHGTVFEFLRNSALDARNFFDRDPSRPLERSDPPSFKRNQYGFTFGGPLQRDKLFFFGSFEGLNDRLTTTSTAFVPSMNARQGIFSTGRVTPSPVTKPIVDTYPLPNGRVFGDTAEYIFTSPKKTDEYYYLIKLDWQVTQNDVISGRYIMDDTKRQIFANLDLGIEDSKTRSQYALLEWKRVISPRLVNEARISLNRPFNVQNQVFLKEFPSVMHFNPLSFNFSGKPRYGRIEISSLTALGFSVTSMQKNVPNRFQYIDNLSYTTGPHSIKMGVNIQRLHLNIDGPFFVPGTYTFRTVQDLVSGATPFTFLGTISGSVFRGMRQTLLGFYLQDDWRVQQNMTLNLGIRYEPYTLPTEVAGRLSEIRDAKNPKMTLGNPLFTKNPSFKNFSPRLGVAWDPFKNGKTSIRAGYGLFLELVNWPHYFAASTQNAPFSIRVLLVNPPFPRFQSALPSDTSSIVTSPHTFSNSIRQGGLHQYQFSIQQQLLEDLVVQIAYVGSRGFRLVHHVDQNTAVPQTDPQGKYPFWPATARRRFPQFGQIRDFEWDSSSWYNSLGLSIRKRFSKGYAVQGSYTFGKSIDNASATTVFDGGGTPNGSSLFPEDVSVDKGLSAYDVRNRLVLNGSWDLPFGRGRAVGGAWSGVLQQIFGGWTLNGIMTASDGSRSNLLLPFNHSRSQQTTDIPDRPNLIAGGDNNPVLADGRDPNRYFDPFQFELGPAGYLTNLARNTLENPGVLTIDFSIFKNFYFDEERYLQFRAEGFNIANRANFSAPNATVFSSATQRNPNVGRITSTVTTSRQIQFALKIYF